MELALELTEHPANLMDSMLPLTGTATSLIDRAFGLGAATVGSRGAGDTNLLSLQYISTNSVRKV